MQSWWRVLRGVWPYRWLVMISMVCALGVGLSYASGVAIMLPVMKIFISAEGVHGWVNRTAVEKRLNISVWDLSQNAQSGKKGIVFIGVPEPKKELAPVLDTTGQAFKMIRHVKMMPDGPEYDAKEDLFWQSSLQMISHAPEGSTLEVEIVGEHSAAETQQISVGKLSIGRQTTLKIVALMPQDSFMGLVSLVIFFIVLCIVGSTFRYWQQYLGMVVAYRVVLDLRRRMYDRITRLPTSYFAQKGTADLMSRLTQDTSTLTQGISMAFGKAIQEPMKAAFSFVFALIIDWRLTLMIVVMTPLLAVVIRKFSKRLRKAGRRALENWSRMLAVINETLIGARVVKAYSAEGFERRRFTRVNKALLHEQCRMAHYNSLSRPTIETLSIIVTSIPMLIAAYWVLHKETRPEDFFTILVCFGAMLEPLRKLSDVNATVQQSNVAGARVFEIIDTPPEPNYNSQLPRLPRHSRTVEFHDVTFRYPGHEELVLQHVSFTVRHGQVVAVVGGNGSGKSTLLSLLPRLYWPSDGAVLVDGFDIANVSLKSLRKQIGLVTQDTLLFADTIYNNIAYGARQSSREEVLAAARRAYADEFITQLPEGYDTKVGEHGTRLSGGQKQRIAIARAILHDPAILILDEAMSQIDADSESKIAEALREFMKDRTTFMIAHRFQTVVSADLIVVLDKGKLVGLGKHHELLEKCTAYKLLYETQFRETAGE